VNHEKWTDLLPAWFKYLLLNAAALYVPILPLILILGVAPGPQWREVALLPIAVLFLNLGVVVPPASMVFAFWTAIFVFSIMACHSRRRRFYSMILFTFSATHAVIVLLVRFVV
jgi:hypothetical protein